VQGFLGARPERFELPTVRFRKATKTQCSGEVTPYFAMACRSMCTRGMTIAGL